MARRRVSTTCGEPRFAAHAPGPSTSTAWITTKDISRARNRQARRKIPGPLRIPAGRKTLPPPLRQRDVEAGTNQEKPKKRSSTKKNENPPGRRVDGYAAWAGRGEQARTSAFSSRVCCVCPASLRCRPMHSATPAAAGDLFRSHGIGPLPQAQRPKTLSDERAALKRATKDGDRPLEGGCPKGPRRRVFFLAAPLHAPESRPFEPGLERRAPSVLRSTPQPPSGPARPCRARCQSRGNHHFPFLSRAARVARPRVPRLPHHALLPVRRPRPAPVSRAAQCRGEAPRQRSVRGPPHPSTPPM